MVTGLCEGVESPPEIFLSPRGASTAAELSRRHPCVRVCSDNQEVADRARVLVVAVRPGDRHEALAGLTVGEGTVVVSAMAGVSLDELSQTLGPGVPVVRSIPLPAARERKSVTVICPADPDATALFDRLGKALPVPDEDALNVFSALTATLTSHYWYLATVTSWAARNGVAAEDADRYVRSLFQGIGRALGDTSRSLPQLAADHETPRGINERIRTTWFDAENIGALEEALDALLADLR